MVHIFYVSWVTVHILVLTIGFAIGLASGLKIPIFGDAFAMLFVGLLLMVTQSYLLNRQFDLSGNWVIYSFIGLILGVAASFVFILVTDSILGLTISHIVALPISLLVLTLFQSWLLRDKFAALYTWPLVSLLALFIAYIFLYLISLQIDLALDLLGDRRPEYSKIPIWGFTGSIIGLIYGLMTGYILINTK
ncbi:MAG: hypothetical protein IH840_15670 [Candidatus Heimdallarchaeota archaeon]|nr:hypothetical protein [Candidatus Heimdallarchaeota archaeon]